jgi:hypothetical protein
MWKNMLLKAYVKARGLGSLRPRAGPGGPQGPQEEGGHGPGPGGGCCWREVRLATTSINIGSELTQNRLRR